MVFILWLSFNAVASVDYIYLRAGRVCGGFKTNLNRKVGGSRQIVIIFFYNLRLHYFFSNGKVRQEGRMNQANLKKSGRVGTWGELFSKYIFMVFILWSFINAVASVDYIYLRAGRVRPGGGGL